MARGPSGRLVIEIDPLLKRKLHSALAAEGTTVKEWFTRQAQSYLHTLYQPSLPGFEHVFPVTVRQVEEAAAAEPPRRRPRKKQE